MMGQPLPMVNNTVSAHDTSSVSSPDGQEEVGLGVTYPSSDIEKALVTAEDLLVEALNLGERDVDLIGLLQNAVLSALENPGTSFSAMVGTHYSETPDEILDWWGGWS